MSQARNERRRLQRLYPEAYKDGFLVVGGANPHAGQRGGYPVGFHQWELGKRNAWWAGANLGYLQKHPREANADAR